MKIPKLLIVAIAFLAITTPIKAQMVFKAYPDNAFIKPNSTDLIQIDVLANDHYYLGQSNDCSREDIVLTILDPQPTRGKARVNKTTNQITYRPNAGEIGADQVLYQIFCPATGKSSTAILYINVNDKPDVISNADCYIDPVGIGFEMAELAFTTANNVATTSTPVLGDVDGDGNVEIFALNYSMAKTELLAYRYNKDTKSLDYLPDYTIDLISNGEALSTFSLAKVDGNPTASIFIVNIKRALLTKYDIDPSGKYTETARATVSKGNKYFAAAQPLVVDLMGNGRTQVCVYDQVYNTKDLALLADGGLIPSSGQSYNYSFGRYGCAFLDTFEAALVAGDIDGDGKLELVGGDCVYKVELVDFDKKVPENSFTLHLRADKTNLPNIGDGGTALVDIDLDGQLDVIVGGPLNNGFITANQGIVYVYNPRTGKLLHTNEVRFRRDKRFQGPSRPFVGDIDGDGYPEICLSSFNVLLAYDLDGSTTLSQKWMLPTDDESSSTTLSLFDFTQDGKARLIYRDQSTLRIIDGSGATPKVDATITNVGSITGNEQPVIADINGDGSAEIIVTGHREGKYSFFGDIRIFGADLTKSKPWATARPVWNQIAYNPLYVNNDLSIPSNPINPATVFYRTDGSVERPFNNYLQQATDLNKEGSMIMLGPDLIFDSREPKRISIDDVANTLTISIGLLNQGDAPFMGPISLQLYAYNKVANSYSKVGPAYIDPNTSGLNWESHDNTTVISYTIPNTLPAGYNDLFMTINLTTAPGEVPIFSGAQECHEGINNFASGFSIVSGKRIMCEGDTEDVSIYPKDTYTVKWYTTGQGGSPIGTGDKLSITKNSDPVEFYFVETYKTPSSVFPISNIRDTIFIHMAPDSLIWTGKGGTNDWHDHFNWTNPNQDLAITANVPRKCTNVLIAGNEDNYPDLADKTNFGATDYSEYLESECNNVHFAHGGEVQRPDLLVYSKAFVDITFNSHRWYMFAPPLKDFYTGDIYRHNVIPFYDDIKSFAQYWSRRNPVSSYYTAGWTNTFHYPDQTFKAGQGVGLWISDKAISGQVTPPRNPFDFSLPKQETSYQVYIKDTNIPEGDPFATPRVNNYRFIFDSAPAGTDFNIHIDGESKAPGDMVLVANPFMAHLNFDEFHSTNSAYIQDYYAILDENAVMQFYNKGTSTLNKNIAPMQAFLVEVKANFTNLKANGIMTTMVPGDKLRSSIEESNAGDFQLVVSATQSGHTHKSFIKFVENANNDYKSGEDIAALFPEMVTSDSRALSLYSLTADGYKTAVNTVSSKGLVNRQIPLGIWSPKGVKSEGLTINISNIDKVPANIDVFLLDKLSGQKHDLKKNSMKFFKDITTDKDAFVDGRFFLLFANTENVSINEKGVENVSAWIHSSILYLHADDIIENIEVCNLQGKVLAEKSSNDYSLEIKLPEEKIYILKIRTSSSTIVKKIINQ